MKPTIIACLIAISLTSPALAAKKKASSAAVPAAAAKTAGQAETLAELLRPMKQVLADPIRIAEDFDPDKLCVCKKWVISEAPCCLEPGPNGSCTREGMCEVSRDCKDWACHRKS